MTKHVTKLAGLTATLLALTAPASAEIKINENFSVSGYAAGAYEYVSPDPGESYDSLFNGAKGTPSADAIKTICTANFKPVTGTISLFYIPNIPTGAMKNELTVLDAFVTYDAGGGISITGGKFLSYLGYEAFDPVNMNQITYSPVTVGTLAAIPAYHTGLKLDYADQAFGFGLAVVDSVYSPFGIDKGDGELKANQGFEGYVKYTGVPDLILWAGFAHDTKGGFQGNKVTVYDLWAEYKVSKQATVAVEYCAKNGGEFAKGSTWLAYMNYAATDKCSIVARVGAEELSGKTAGSDFMQYTVGPSCKLTDNLTVRAEVSYYDYDKGGSKTLFGVQGIFRF
jgi:hypothetical protein